MDICFIYWKSVCCVFLIFLESAKFLVYSPIVFDYWKCEKKSFGGLENMRKFASNESWCTLPAVLTELAD